MCIFSCVVFCNGFRRYCNPQYLAGHPIAHSERCGHPTGQYLRHGADGDLSSGGHSHSPLQSALTPSVRRNAAGQSLQLPDPADYDHRWGLPSNQHRCRSDALFDPSSKVDPGRPPPSPSHAPRVPSQLLPQLPREQVPQAQPPDPDHRGQPGQQAR